MNSLMEELMNERQKGRLRMMAMLMVGVALLGADGARTQLMAEAPCNFESDFKDDIDFWPDPKIHGFGTATGGDWAWVADNYVAGEGWHSDFQNGYTTQHGTHGRCGAGPM